MNFKSESLKALAPALVKAQKSMGVAVKDSKNPFFKSNYADLSSVIDASLPAFNAEGIAILQLNDVGPNGLPVVQTVLLHESGEYIGSNTPVIVSKVNDPQALGSAISYARRYGLQSTVTLKNADDDGEAAMGRAPTIERGSVNLSSVAKASTSATAEASTSTGTLAPVKHKPSFRNVKKAASSESTGDLI